MKGIDRSGSGRGEERVRSKERDIKRGGNGKKRRVINTESGERERASSMFTIC